MEAILALEPELVIYSADIEGHLEAAAVLAQGGIPCYAAKVEAFDDYLKVLADFTALTGRGDLYEQNARGAGEDRALGPWPLRGRGAHRALSRAYSAA